MIVQLYNANIHGCLIFKCLTNFYFDYNHNNIIYNCCYLNFYLLNKTFTNIINNIILYFSSSKILYFLLLLLLILYKTKQNKKHYWCIISLYLRKTIILFIVQL